MQYQNKDITIKQKGIMGYNEIRELRHWFEQLVGCRYDRTDLIRAINDLIWRSNIHLDFTYINVVDAEDRLSNEDFRFDFALEKCDIIGSIWYLKTNDVNNPYYITEVSIDKG